MPLYEYECEACHRRTEKIQKFSDPELTTCPFCGGILARTVTAPAIQFKGAGWYKDLYSSAKPTPAGGGAGESAASSSEGGNGNKESGSKDAGAGGRDAGGKDGGGKDTKGGSSSRDATAAPSAPAVPASPSSGSVTS